MSQESTERESTEEIDIELVDGHSIEEENQVVVKNVIRTDYQRSGFGWTSVEADRESTGYGPKYGCIDCSFTPQSLEEVETHVWSTSIKETLLNLESKGRIRTGSIAIIESVEMPDEPLHLNAYSDDKGWFHENYSDFHTDKSESMDSEDEILRFYLSSETTERDRKTVEKALEKIISQPAFEDKQWVHYEVNDRDCYWIGKKA